MKWKYSNSTNTIWTSFDYGEVEAETYKEAYEKAVIELKYNLHKVNEVLASADVTSTFTIDMNFEQIEVELLNK